MPMNHRVDTRRNLIWLTGTELLADGDIAFSVEALRKDHRVSADMRTLADMLGVVRFGLGEKGMDDLIALLSRSGEGAGPAKAAVVVTPAMHEEMNEIFRGRFTNLAKQISFEQFYSLDAAVEWLQETA